LQDNPIGYTNTLLRYYLPGLDIDSLSDAQWAETFAQVMEIRKQEKKQSQI